MVACGHCGGCCAHCGTACGHLGGGSFGGGGFAGGFGGFGFHPFFGGVPGSYAGHGVPIDAVALSDPDNPGHRDAIQAIAHIAGEKFEKLAEWLKEERHKADHGADSQK
ncbi:MAG: hypothetical protein WCF25_08065 [Acidimicrobiales bacterium]